MGRMIVILGLTTGLVLGSMKIRLILVLVLVLANLIPTLKNHYGSKTGLVLGSMKNRLILVLANLIPALKNSHGNEPSCNAEVKSAGLLTIVKTRAAIYEDMLSFSCMIRHV